VCKIWRMADAWGWPIQRLDASATVHARLRGVGPDAESACWEPNMRAPGLAAIGSFLLELDGGGVVVGAVVEVEPRVRCCEAT
jgi:adenylate dimethylallyltransferase (cytokinin synthase)